jgi:small GTP-binding protein
LTLLARYDALRRKEFEAVTSLVETLGKVDGLPPEQMDQARDALFHTDHPFLIVLIGGFNTGKSSILNALIGDQALGVGPTPTTDRIILLRHGETFSRIMTGDTDTVYHPSKLLEQVSLVDTPGLESVFKGHDDITRRFLHRADAVFLVLLATQAMSQANVEYLKSLRAYGKRVILIINQIDLLDAAEREQVRTFVTTQAQQYLEMAPEVWLVSAKLAAQARQATPRDPTLWEASGFGTIERFILQTLNDAERIRGKLETPVQILRRVSATALDQTRQEQTALNAYRKSAQNVRSQAESGVAEQRNTVDAAIEEANRAFTETAMRGAEAIGQIFQLNRAMRLAGGGAFELIGLGLLTRRLGARTPARAAFEAAKVLEPLTRLPGIVDGLAPRLEGRDVKDTDDLLDYTRKEIDALPPGLRSRLVGGLTAPVSYDRTIIPSRRDTILNIAERAKAVEFERIDRAVQGSVIVLAVYEIVVLLLAIIFASALGSSSNGGAWALLVLLTLGLLIGGLALVPLRGVLMARAFSERMQKTARDFTDQLRAAANQQISYGERMRMDTVAPFLRLIDTQTSRADNVQNELTRGQQTLTALERELAALP